MAISRFKLCVICLSVIYPFDPRPSWVFETPVVLEKPLLIGWSSYAGILDGCNYIVYRLSPATTQKLREQGIEFFNGSESIPLSNSEHNPFGPWSQTPVPSNRHIFALNGTGCGGPTYPFDLNKAVRGTEAFYTLAKNDEGIWFVDMTEGIVIYSYFG